VSLTAFLASLNTGTVKEVIDYGDTISFKSSDGKWFSTNTATIPKADLISATTRNSVEYTSKSPSIALAAIPQIVAALGASIMLYTLTRNPTPKRVLEHQTGISFKDIAGNQEAKQSLQEIIQFFKNPEKFIKVGATLPRGVLLFGPPGTGKTMLAKAVATEAGVNFIQTSGSEYIELFVGVGAKRVRDVFTQARENSPCIIFIDEVDSLALQRGAMSDKSNMELHSTVNQLLSEMDGFVQSDKIVVLAATNKHTILDDAILRPGRFDRKIQVSLPEYETRLQILKFNLANRQNEISEDCLKMMAENTDNCNGAEIASIINEASFLCVRDDRECITESDVIEAFRRMKEGKLRFVAEKLAKSMLAYHK